MGLIKAIMGATGGVLADQWKEYFYCDALPADVLVRKARKRTSGRSSNTKGFENIITKGSVISVANGQCMMIVDQGRVTEICAEPGEYTYDGSTEPSVMCGNLSESIPAVLKNIGKRFTFGGEAPKDQRIYYFNTRELVGNKYGTPAPVPFRVSDPEIGMNLTVNIRCFGEYSYRITNPVLFYSNVCSNVEQDFMRSEIDGQMKSELLMALQPALAQISKLRIDYSEIPAYTIELAKALNEVLSDKWRDLRGMEIVSMGVSSVKATEEDEARIKELQRNATFRDPTMAAAHLVGAQASAMQAAANNEGAGAAMAFMGVNMAGQAGGANAQSLYQMGQQPQNTPAPGADSWKCACGHVATGKFCPECGAKKPAPKSADSWKCVCGYTATGKFCPECGAKRPDSNGWVCTCGTVNKGKFCSECGAKKPAGVPQYRCDKCGWEPEDPAHPPKFCPECGDPFDSADRK